MATSVQKVIKEKKTKINELREEVKLLNALLEKYPDLERHTDRWYNERLMTEQVNAVADQCSFSHSCGCCNDSPLYVWPYIEVDGIKIYSKPPNINIGEKNPYPVPGEVYKPERAYLNWKEILEKHNISKKIIEKCREYLEIEADMDNDDWEDDEDLS